MSNDDKRRYLILKDKNIIKGLLLLSLPVMLNNFARTIHDLVDMYFLGKIEDMGTESIAAIQLTFPIIFMYISLGIGLSIAGTALISQFYGANQTDTAKKYATHLTIIALIIGVLLNIISFVIAHPVTNLLGSLNDSSNKIYVLNQAALYLQIRSFELPFLFVFFAFTSIRQASGDTHSPVYLGVLTIIFNIILTPIMVLGEVPIVIEFLNIDTTLHFLDFGVRGAAIATTFATIIVMPIGFYLLFKAKSGITISLNYLRLEKASSKEIITTALPASVGQSITAVGFAVLNTFIFSYGIETTSAFGVGNRISSIFLHPVMAIGTVMAAYIGQNIGNLNEERAKRVFKDGLILSIGLMSIGSIIGLLIREPMAGLFIDSSDPAFDLSVKYMFFLFIGLPLMAVFQAYIGVYNGTGRTIFTLLIGVTRLWAIRIPLIVGFTYFTNLGNSGIWYAMLISNFLMVFIGGFFMRFVSFKPKVKLEQVEI
jgi:putative MATE family efflux protein